MNFGLENKTYILNLYGLILAFSHGIFVVKISNISACLTILVLPPGQILIIFIRFNINIIFTVIIMHYYNYIQM